jgi:L-ectoine synthase
MIIRTLLEESNSHRRVDADGWSSVRLLLKDDGMGFSLHITTIHAGAELAMHYKRHLEAVYCLSGEGSVEDLQSAQVTQVRPGVLYALDRNDKHVLRAKSELQMVCVFNPALKGLEVHDESGAYPLDTEAV